jgi:hypothetical protein
MKFDENESLRLKPRTPLDTVSTNSIALSRLLLATPARFRTRDDGGGEGTPPGMPAHLRAIAPSGMVPRMGSLPKLPILIKDFAPLA